MLREQRAFLLVGFVSPHYLFKRKKKLFNLTLYVIILECLIKESLAVTAESPIFASVFSRRRKPGNALIATSSTALTVQLQLLAAVGRCLYQASLGLSNPRATAVLPSLPRGVYEARVIDLRPDSGGENKEIINSENKHNS